MQNTDIRTIAGIKPPASAGGSMASAMRKAARTNISALAAEARQ